ncbi:hypothetical protein [Nocardiopsis xinjiangensis]|uniref:hypothetical protein n=1 Tax=Nocardiopsis xinjiangensis TaxID=124285 RepID=UPI0003452C41|nr:hypothetical protein [Nocardiopsis xinjiangensis]
MSRTGAGVCTARLGRDASGPTCGDGRPDAGGEPVSEVAFERGAPREYELRKHTYAALEARGLGAQAAQHTIKKVRDASTVA